MSEENRSNIEEQSKMAPPNTSQNNSNPLINGDVSEPSFHSSQIKRPQIHFNDPSQIILDENNSQIINQTFNTYAYNFSKLANNFQNANSSNNSDFLNLNKSEQQEKYDVIKNYCIKKNDPDNYPLISYENFLLIDSLGERNIPECERYKNFLLNKNASIELFSKFCTLLMNRYIISRQNSSINKYPRVVYQIIFDINNINIYLSPDIVADAKQSNMFMALINYENMWNVLAMNQSNNFSNYFMFNKNTNKKLILNLMNHVAQTIYPNNKFEFTVSDYSGFSNNSQIILPFIILDFYSRYKSNLPIDEEDYYYQTILILSEIMTCKLITK